MHGINLLFILFSHCSAEVPPSVRKGERWACCGDKSRDAQSGVGIRQRKCLVSLVLNEEQRRQEAERGGEAILDTLLI